MLATMGIAAATWLAAFAEKLGLDAPTDAEVEAILALAGTAAHASERTAAPIACWLAAKAGIDPFDARDLANSIAVLESDTDSE